MRLFGLWLLPCLAFVSVLASPPAAPTIFKATALGSSAIQIAWRDNSTNEAGFIVYHRLSSDTLFVARDTVGQNSTECIDSGLLPSTNYSYAVKAFNDSGVSAASNIDSATTQNHIVPQDTPVVAAWFSLSVDSATGRVSVHIQDANISETGYRIQRGTSSADLKLIATVLSASPAETGTISWSDSTAEVGRLLYYRVTAFNSRSFAESPVSWVFSYRTPDLDSISMHVVSSTSLHYAGWAVLQGDTLFCKELIGTDTVISLVSLKDSLKPAFIGTADSILLKRYSSTLVSTAVWNDKPNNFADEPVLEYPYLYRNARVWHGPSISAYRLNDTIGSFKLEQNFTFYSDISHLSLFNMVSMNGYLLAAGSMGYRDFGVNDNYVIFLSQTKPILSDISHGARVFWSIEQKGMLPLKVSVVSDSIYALSWLYLPSSKYTKCNLRSPMHYSGPLFEIDLNGIGRPIEPISLRYPYVYWCDSATITVTNMWQAGRQTILGSAPLGYPVRKVLFDTRRNFIIAIGDFQMSVISVGADLRQHPMVTTVRHPRPVAHQAFNVKISGTKIIFSSQLPASTVLTIHNATGRQVDRFQPDGRVSSIDISRLPPGLYIARLKTGLKSMALKLFISR